MRYRTCAWCCEKLCYSNFELGRSQYCQFLFNSNKDVKDIAFIFWKSTAGQTLISQHIQVELHQIFLGRTSRQLRV